VDSIPGTPILDPAAAAQEQGKRATAVLGVLAAETPLLPSGARPGAGGPGIRISLGWLQIDGPGLIRLLTVGVCFGAALFLLSQSQGSQSGQALGAGIPRVQPQEALSAFLGFCTHRVAIVLAAFRRKT